ncbi:MAG: pantoate--beta-alanine ligase [Pseudomonadota bacterium]
MKTCRNIAAARATLADLRAGGATVGLVPTMGALHEGHLALVRAAKARCDAVVATIFVNPTQFGEAEDLAKYPRDEARDLAMLEAEGVSAVFLPTIEEMYPTGTQTIVEVTDLSQVLVGKVRPGHFRGVTTVVTKLFNIIQADAAFFGEKDYQQLAVIRQMVRDLDMPIEIVGVPIVREPDGLAMSSRNLRLTPAHRDQSVVLSQSIKAAEAALSSAPQTVESLRETIAKVLKTAPDAQVEAIDIQDATTLADLSGPLTHAAVVLLAVRFGAVLLIDAQVITPG